MLGGCSLHGFEEEVLIRLGNFLNVGNSRWLLCGDFSKLEDGCC